MSKSKGYTTEQGTVRHVGTFSKKQYNRMASFAKKNGMSVAEVLRQSESLFSFIASSYPTVYSNWKYSYKKKSA